MTNDPFSKKAIVLDYGDRRASSTTPASQARGALTGRSVAKFEAYATNSGSDGVNFKKFRFTRSCGVRLRPDFPGRRRLQLVRDGDAGGLGG